MGAIADESGYYSAVSNNPTDSHKGKKSRISDYNFQDNQDTVCNPVMYIVRWGMTHYNPRESKGKRLVI